MGFIIIVQSTLGDMQQVPTPSPIPHCPLAATGPHHTPSEPKILLGLVKDCYPQYSNGDSSVIPDEWWDAQKRSGPAVSS